MSAEKTKETVLRVIIAIALTTLIFSGCGKPERFVRKSYDIPDPNAIPLPKSQNTSTFKGGMTISVAGETITTDDIVSAGRVLDRLRPKAAGGDYAYFHQQSYDTVSYMVSEKIKDILLCYIARKNAPSGIDENLDKAVEKEVNRYVAAFESNYEALKDIKKMGFNGWDDFRDYKRKQFLKQSYLSTKVKTDETVSRNELLQRYSELKTLEDAYFDRGPITQQPEMSRILTALKAQYKKADAETYFRLIEIRPAQLDESQIDTSKEETGHQAAMRIAKDLRSRIDAGEDFAQIAAGFHGPYKNDKDPDRYTLGGLFSPYDILETQARKAKAGEVIGPVDAEDRVFIMKIESRQAAGIVPFEKIQNILELQIRLERQLVQYEEVYRQLAAAAAITDKEKFINACIDTAFMRLKPE
ncbi:MAG: hypothetical protein FVQ79_07035 [Planctomycetes bacterium]|nr:hypothetical protein [Planctomycetota bacterium]